MVTGDLAADVLGVPPFGRQGARVPPRDDRAAVVHDTTLVPARQVRRRGGGPELGVDSSRSTRRPSPASCSSRRRGRPSTWGCCASAARPTCRRRRAATTTGAKPKGPPPEDAAQQARAARRRRVGPPAQRRDGRRRRRRARALVEMAGRRRRGRAEGGQVRQPLRRLRPRSSIAPSRRRRRRLERRRRRARRSQADTPLRRRGVGPRRRWRRSEERARGGRGAGGGAVPGTVENFLSSTRERRPNTAGRSATASPRAAGRGVHGIEFLSKSRRRAFVVFSAALTPTIPLMHCSPSSDTSRPRPRHPRPNDPQFAPSRPLDRPSVTRPRLKFFRIHPQVLASCFPLSRRSSRTTRRDRLARRRCARRETRDPTSGGRHQGGA